MAIVRKDLSELRLPQYPLTELGYFTENQCKVVKEMMDNTTFMNFIVGWSNCAGNCTLIVKTDYKDDAEEIKRFFISAFMRVAIDIVKDARGGMI